MTKISQDDYNNLINKKKKKSHRNNPEGKIQLQILKYLLIRGFVCGKTKTVGGRIGNRFLYDRYNFRGKCDLEAFSPDGVMYGIEVKSKTGVLSEEQKKYKALFHKSPDRIYIEAHCLEDVIENVK